MSLVLIECVCRCDVMGESQCSNCETSTKVNKKVADVHILTVYEVSRGEICLPAERGECTLIGFELYKPLGQLGHTIQLFLSKSRPIQQFHFRTPAILTGQI